MPVLLPLRSSVHSPGRPIVVHKLSRALLYAYPSVASRREPCRAASLLCEPLSPSLAPSEGHLAPSHMRMKGGYPQRVFDHSDIRTDFRSYSSSDNLGLSASSRGALIVPASIFRRGVLVSLVSVNGLGML